MAMMRVPHLCKLSTSISSANYMTSIINMGPSSIRMPRCTRLFSLQGGRMNHPGTTKFRKQHRGRMKGISSRGNHISFGTYALQALEPAWITARQIEAGRRAMTQYLRRGGKIWVRIFPDKPVTRKSAETRMGSGKGSPEYWVSVVKPGRILYEINGISEAMARIATSIAASKLPVRTQFVIRSHDTVLDVKENVEGKEQFIEHFKYSGEDLDSGETMRAIQEVDGSLWGNS